jgi:ribosomal protein S27AE
MNTLLILEVVPCAACGRHVTIAFALPIFSKWLCGRCYTDIDKYCGEAEFEKALFKLVDERLVEEALKHL